METLFINKLAPPYKKFVRAKEPGMFQELIGIAVALWRRNNPEGIALKPKSIFAIESDYVSNLANLSPEDREECINALRNKRNSGQNFRQNGGFSNYSNNKDNKQQSKPKKDKKKTYNNYTAIKCWFCSKTGHTQIRWRTRIAHNKLLTWCNKEVKSKYHNNKIFALVDLEDLDEI